MQERKRVRVCARKIKHVQEQVLCVQERKSVQACARKVRHVQKQVRVCKSVRAYARKVRDVQEQVLCVQERASVCKESLGFANVCEGAQVRMCKER